MQDIKGAIIEGNEDGKYAKKVKVAGSKQPGAKKGLDAIRGYDV